ncbi:P-loop NTPase fold protein [Carboxylicivirga sp. RSCT41]|uniref:P-loop NTPase fold protein n=1 Tax=Carboxylicivirga agarovorans TaxID=3417570 RepID=UPI003D327C77
MDKYIKMVEEYISIKTNYAIILSGSYGVGKTHFFEKHITHLVEQMPVSEGNAMYKPIHVSLFGLKDIEELQTQILYRQFESQDRNVSALMGVGRAVVKKVIGDDVCRDLEGVAGGLIDFSKIVLCIDDIDRKDEVFQYSTLFGYINMLVEKYGTKVLLIADENKLLEYPKYKEELKEKVVGVTIKYKPDIQEAFNSIIDERTEGYYRKYLYNEKKLILKVIEGRGSNLRHLVFFVEWFKRIYERFVVSMLEDNNQYELKDEVVLSVFYFSLVVCVEFKSGDLNAKNYDKIRDAAKEPKLIWAPAAKVNRTEEQKEANEYREKFMNAYYTSAEYLFFDSIFNNIIGEDALNIKKLKKEVSGYFPVGKEYSDLELLFKDLDYMDCLNLSLKEFRLKVTKMLGYIDRGELDLIDYFKAFKLITNFNNIYGFDLKKLVKRIKRGIKVGANNYSYESNLHVNFRYSSYAAFQPELQEIIRFCLEFNKELKEIEQREKSEMLFTILKRDVVNFKRLMEEDDDNFFSNNPFLNHFTAYQIYQVINKMNNEDVIVFRQFITGRFTYTEIRKSEREVLQELKHLINKPKRRKVKNIRNFVLDELVIELTNFIDTVD